MEIPVVSRLYFTGAFLTTAGCALDIISPFSLYYNFDLIFSQGQIWRLFTTYLFFGMFSIDFLFHMYFLVSSVAPGRGCRINMDAAFRPMTVSHTSLPPLRISIKGSVLSIIGRGGLSRSDRKLCLHAALWDRLDDFCGTLLQRPFPRFFFDIYDDLRVGPKKRTRSDVLPGSIHLPCTIPSLGDARLFRIIRQSRDD